MNGDRIKHFREESGYTQEKLASELGVSRQTVALMESGRYNPSLKICLRLASLLNRSLDDLFGNEGGIPLDNEDLLAILDIGSTATKAVLLKRKEDTWDVIADSYVKTTVEEPDNDVTAGVLEALRELNKQFKGKKLVTSSGKPALPLLATSSAGGGLQIAVFGVSSTDTGEVASHAANGAGGVILRRFTVDDELPVIERMRFLHDIHPDMILLAGGVDGGNIASVIRLAEILALSEPTTKYSHQERPPVVFAGNKGARELALKTLKDFDCHVTENLRPTLETTNIFPAQSAIHDLFLHHVMEKAPGYKKLKKWADDRILPTPAAVEKILSLYGETQHKNVVLADMGGATTDLFSNIIGEYNRTVAANIGMSYSLGQILKEAGEEKVSERFQPSVTAELIRNYCGNKMIYPVRIPHKDWEIQIEQHMAVLGLQLAWEQHQKANFKLKRVGLLDRRRKEAAYDPFAEVLSIRDTPKLFQYTDIDLFVGAGGVLSHVRHQAEALHILIDGFLPEGVTTLAVDQGFHSPHFGMLSTLFPTEALEAFVRSSLNEVAYVLAPLGKYDEKKTALTLIKDDGALSSDIPWGALAYYPQGLKAKIVLSKNVSLGDQQGEMALNSKIPVVIDCRGRGKYFNGRPFTDYVTLYTHETPPVCKAPAVDEAHHTPAEYDKTLLVRRRLPYKGEILVKEGESVLPDTPVGENNMTPPRVFLVDLHRLLGYDVNASNEDLKAGLVIRAGDTVSSQDVIFDGHIKKHKYLLRTPVRGRVMAIEDNGIIILEEIQDYSVKPVTIPVASLLNTKPKHMKGFLAVKEGDFVEKGIHLVKFSPLTSSLREMSELRAPVTGIVKEVNVIKGTVTLQYDFETFRLPAFVKGTVKEVIPGYEALIETKGDVLNGRIGFGHEHWGLLSSWEDPDKKGKILFFNGAVTQEQLIRCRDENAAGLVAPSMSLTHWRDFYGEELGVAITGDEDIPFTLLLTKGFGESSFEQKTLEFLESRISRLSSVSGRTQIRAGVIRPFLLVSR